MSTGKVLLGVMAGIAAGATLGILFAPDKGSSTRKKISKKGDEYADELKEKFNEFSDSMSKKYESVKEQASRLVKKGKHMDEEVEKEETVAAD
jgi:gas vesicle protein